MRKFIVFNVMTLDGYFEGPNHDISWHNVDSEFNEFAIAQLNEIDTLIFGRVTYELMASYWPTEEGIKDDPAVAKLMNDMDKIVVSTTVQKADWKNTRIVKDNVYEEIKKLKQTAGKSIAIFGSAKLASALMKQGLIDEYRILVNPVILGSGTPLFADIKEQMKLKVVDTRTFKNGNVLVSYHFA